jgi:hypothetical protein
MRSASTREKLLAALVDAAVAIAALGIVLGLGVGAAVAYTHPSAVTEVEVQQDEEREDEEREDEEREDEDQEDQDDEDERPRSTRYRLGELRRSHAVRTALGGARAGFAIAGRNWRSPGFRVVGLRRVDARTGGPLSVRSALIGVLFDQARQAATRPLSRSRVHATRDRRSELAPKLKEIEREHSTDGEGRRRAVEELYRANGIKRSAGCGWQVAAGVLSQVLLAATAIPDGRTVYDRLTGTIVVSFTAAGNEIDHRHPAARLVGLAPSRSGDARRRR